jgi:hypothetical protein
MAAEQKNQDVQEVKDTAILVAEKETDLLRKGFKLFLTKGEQAGFNTTGEFRFYAKEADGKIVVAIPCRKAIVAGEARARYYDFEDKVVALLPKIRGFAAELNDLFLIPTTPKLNKGRGSKQTTETI